MDEIQQTLSAMMGAAFQQGMAQQQLDDAEAAVINAQHDVHKFAAQAVEHYTKITELLNIGEDQQEPS